MKDQVIALLEAIRLSQAALAKHFQPGGPNAEATNKELHWLLEDQHVVAAVEALCPNVASPSTSPVDMSHVEDSGELHPIGSA
jgi:hypothetical protein